MPEFTTAPTKSQAAVYPLVSYQLILRVGARRDARRHRVSPAVAEAAVVEAFKRTRGNRYEARRAGWAAVDRLAWPGVGEG